MVSISYSRLATFSFLFSLTFHICVATNSVDYEKWLLWNKHYYLTTKANATTSTESMTTQVPANVGAKILDDKLRLAEMSTSTISVSQSGAGNFKTIKEAIASIPSHNTRRVLINIGPGVYREKIKIPKHMDFISFLGDAGDPPTITGHDSAGKSSRTFESATVGVDADYFMAVNVKFENTHPHVDSSEGDQAVALRISGTKASFYNCGFYGSQDTLYDHKGLHYFKNCFIQGSVDFIFGYGRSLYENCELKSIANNTGSLTAQKREKTSSMESGFSFKDCKVSGSGQVYLGRAWDDYSRIIFSYTFLDKIILPQGWHNWGIPRREKTVYYGEYKCSGPGSNMSGRVSWARALTDEEAQPFLGTYYVDGDAWLSSSP